MRATSRTSNENTLAARSTASHPSSAPPHRLHVVHVADRVLGRPHAERVQRPRDPLGRAHEHPHLMTGAQERVHAVGPDEPGRTRTSTFTGASLPGLLGITARNELGSVLSARTHLEVVAADEL